MNFFNVLQEIELYYKKKQIYDDLNTINNLIKKCKKKEINSNNINDFIRDNINYLNILCLTILQRFELRSEKRRLKKILFLSRLFVTSKMKILKYLKNIMNYMHLFVGVKKKI